MEDRTRNGAKPPSSPQHCESCSTMDYCRPSPLGVALCSICGFINAEPWRFPLYHAAMIHAQRLAAMVTRGGNPDTLYRDACARLTLPILRVASLALRNGAPAMLAGPEVLA